MTRGRHPRFGAQLTAAEAAKLESQPQDDDDFRGLTIYALTRTSAELAADLKPVFRGSDGGALFVICRGLRIYSNELKQLADAAEQAYNRLSLVAAYIQDGGVQ